MSSRRRRVLTIRSACRSRRTIVSRFVRVRSRSIDITIYHFSPSISTLSPSGDSTLVRHCTERERERERGGGMARKPRELLQPSLSQIGDSLLFCRVYPGDRNSPRCRYHTRSTCARGIRENLHGRCTPSIESSGASLLSCRVHPGDLESLFRQPR